MENIERLHREARSCARWLQGLDEVEIVSHIDADGLSTCGVLVQALRREGIAARIRFVRNGGEALGGPPDLPRVFAELGSGRLDDVQRLPCPTLVVDHHPTVGRVDRAGPHRVFNPRLLGFDGTQEISGSGTAYLIARALDAANADLAALAIVGAVGDRQDRRHGRLIGLNRTIVEEGSRAGVLEARVDLHLFGRQTRPLIRLLEATGLDPGFLHDLDIPVKNGHWLRWGDLAGEERMRLASGLVQWSLATGQGAEAAQRLLAEGYTLPREPEGTPFRDASEYASLLNATARYGEGQVGLDLCLGDRDGAYRRARTLLGRHRKNISAGLALVHDQGLEERSHFSYFCAEDRIRDTILGIITGMALERETGAEKPLVAFARAPEGLKVSARATPAHTQRGLDLGPALMRAAHAVGGDGGGHDIAGGATIPPGAMEEFLDHLDREIGVQMAG
ncbi:MAG: DHH family phosphoesterase [Euryarchaeota archaeon]|nr:DHH family phosphoesterase [Euryarchaeota archaeon]